MVVVCRLEDAETIAPIDIRLSTRNVGIIEADLYPVPRLAQITIAAERLIEICIHANTSMRSTGGSLDRDRKVVKGVEARVDRTLEGSAFRLNWQSAVPSR